MLEPAAEGAPSVPLPSEFAVASRTDGVYYVVDVIGEVDAATGPALELALDAAMASPATEIVVDLGGCTFFCSVGLAALTKLNQHLSYLEGRTLSILPGPRQVQRVFEITGLLDVLPFAE